MSGIGPYMPRSEPYPESLTRFQEEALARQQSGCVNPAGSPGCWDWSSYCGNDEFAEPYWLDFDFFDQGAGNLAAGAQRQRVRTVTPEGRFIAVGLNGRGSILPLDTAFSVQIMAVGSGRELMNDFIPSDSIVGDLWNASNGNATPGEFFIPRQFAKQGSIRITIRNDSGVNITDAHIVMYGFKVLNRRALNANIQDCLR